MAATYDLLGEVTATGSSGTLSLAAIPQTHNDLVIFFSGWGLSGTNSYADGIFRVNGTTSSVYSSNQMSIINNTTQSAQEETGQTSCRILNISCDTSTTYPDRAYFQIDINNYRKLLFSGTTKVVNFIAKQATAHSLASTILGNVGTTSYGFTDNAPITSCTLTLNNAANFGNGSTLQVYGITNA
jgi:hypothetical protein